MKPRLFFKDNTALCRYTMLELEETALEEKLFNFLQFTSSYI